LIATTSFFAGVGVGVGAGFVVVGVVAGTGANVGAGAGLAQAGRKRSNTSIRITLRNTPFFLNIFFPSFITEIYYILNSHVTF
jgi:hypothetical protein